MASRSPRMGRRWPRAIGRVRSGCGTRRTGNPSMSLWPMASSASTRSRSIDTGTALAAAGFSGSVIVWDTADWERKLELTIDNAVLSLAFSPDGAVLAAGTETGEVQFIDMATGEPIGGPVTGQRDWVNTVAFSPDGESLVAGSEDGSISLISSTAWSDDVAALGETLCSVAGRGLTEGEWDALVPFKPYDPGCPNDLRLSYEDRGEDPDPRARAGPRRVRVLLARRPRAGGRAHPGPGRTRQACLGGPGGHPALRRVDGRDPIRDRGGRRLPGRGLPGPCGLQGLRRGARARPGGRQADRPGPGPRHRSRDRSPRPWRP